MHHRAIDRLREAACLAHTVPGTTLRLRADVGRSLLVSRHCLGADLDPCQFRAAMSTPTGEHLAATVTGIDLVAGLVDLGGGLYRRSGEHGVEERWFLTRLPHDQIVQVLGECPVPPPRSDLLDVVIKPDPELGLCAVRLASPRADLVLDEVALWTWSGCLVEELLVDVATEAMR